MIVTPRASHCFSSLIWLSRNKSVQKSCFSRIVENSREFSLFDLDLEAFWFHFSLLEKEWKHFFFTLHFSKKSENILFSLCTSRKRVKAFLFHFSLLELQKPTLASPWYVGAMLMLAVLLWNKTEWIWVSMAFWSIVEIWKKWEWFDKEDSTSLQRRFHFSRPYVSLKSSLLSFVTHILNPLDMLIDRVLVPSWFITYILQSSYEKRAAGQV